MKHKLSILMLLAALLVPWVTQAQVVQQYDLTTGVDQTKWVTLSSSATTVTAVLGDDSPSSVMDIGFTFMFAGVNYYQWSCNSNGRVRLGSTVVSNYWVNPFTTTSLTNTSYGSDLPLIAAFGMDNTLEGTGAWCKYEVVGTAPNRMLVIEYRTPSEYDEEGDLVNYQIQLEESTNVVRFVYGTTAASTYDDFQAGIAADVNDVLTVSATHDTITGATSVVRSAWPGVWRYYEFTHPTTFCAANGNLVLDSVDGENIIISWAPSASAASYLVTIGNTEYTTTDTSYTFSGLNANTSYTISVSTICNNGDTSIARTATYRTACGYMAIPYLNGFEDDPHYSTVTYANAVPFCWTRINDASGTSNYYPYLTNTASYVHSGSVGMYWYHSTTTTYANNEYAILPPFDPSEYDASELTLSFFAKTTSTSYHPQPIIGVMTDPTDTSTFTPVYTFTSTQITTTWTNFVVPLSSYTGTGNYVAIKWPRPSSTCYLAIDDIYLTDDWCNMPSSVSVANVTTESVTLNWVASGATDFVVYLGNDTVTVSNSNSYTFNGLTPSTSYNYGVAVQCSSSNSMFVTGAIRTECTLLDTLPYSYGFEGMATTSSTVHPEIPCWHHINNGTQYFGYPYVTSTNHTGTRSLYWNGSTTSGTYGDYQIVVLPGVDPTYRTVNTLQLRFWAKASSASYHPVFVVGVMTNPNDATTFQAVETVNVEGTTWQEFTVSLGAYTGTGNYVALRANRPSSTWYAYTDDFTLEPLPNCPSLTNLEATATVGAALLTWGYQAGYDAPAGFVVTYDSIGGTTPTTINVTDNSAILTGLMPATDYKAYVYANCGSEGNGRVDSISFSTSNFGCQQPDTTLAFSDTIGNGTSTSTYLPSYSFYNYGLTQQIYTAAEIGHGGTIDNISFMWSTVSQQRTYEIYMAHTASATADNFLHPADLTLVYNGGPVTLTADQWTTFNLTTPFNYNGSDNLVVIMRDMTGSYVSGNAGYVHSVASGAARYVYQDGSAYDPYTYSGGTALSVRNNIIIGGAPCAVEATCAAPAAMVTDKTPNSVTITWIPGADETMWNVDYRAADSTTWISAATALSANTYTITSLTPGTDYEFRVSFVCNDVNNTVYSSTVTTRTPCVEISIPYTYSFEGLSTTSSTTRPDIPCWNHLNNGTSYFGYPYLYASAAHTGSIGLYWYASTTTGTYGDYEMVVLPPVDTAINPINTLQLTFWAKPTGTSYAPVFQVGVMTDPENASTFQSVVTINLQTGNTNWKWYDAILSSYTGTGRYVAIRANRPSSAWYAYLDDVTLENIPPCAHVNNVHTTFVGQDSIMLAWTPVGEETEWIVSYNDTSITAYADSLLITDLSPSTIYNFSIVSVCSDDDTSIAVNYTARTACGKLNSLPYVQDFENENTTSSTSSTFIPCWGHLNNGTSYPGYPYLSASTTYNHTDNGGKGLYWYGCTTTGTYGDYYVLVLPEVDTTVLPINTLKLSFWAKSSSTSYFPIFYVGVMSDPTDVTTFRYFDTINVGNNTSWERYTTIFSGWADSGSYIAIRANRPSSTWYAYMDDIVLDAMPACPAVEDVAVIAGTTSAIVTWNTLGTANVGASVEYKVDTTTSWNTVTVTGDNYAVLTGLDPNTNYDVNVIGTCAEGVATAVSSEFTTRGFACAVLDPTNSHFDTVTGATTVTSYQRPVNNFYRNTFSEQIYDSTELAGPGTIAYFSLNYGYSTPMADKTNCMVYMANTTLSTVSPTSYLTPSNMTLVYTGSLNCVSGWNEFELDVPFIYNGGNLAVAVVDNSGEYDGSAYVWNGHDAAGKSFSWYSDSYTYPNSSMSTNTDAFRPDMAFSFIDCIQLSTCAAPVVYLTGTTTTTASIVWAPGNTDTAWNVYYRHSNDANYTLAASGVTATSYTFTGLNSGSMYYLKVENACGTEVLSAEVEAVTECAAITSLPFSENFNGWGVGSGVLPNCWSRNGSYSTYTYISASYNMSGSTGGSVYMYQGSSTPYTSYASTLILPQLDTTVYQANQTQLVFSTMYATASYGRPKFEIGVLTDPDNFSTFVPVDTVQHSGGINRWETFEVPLAAYTGNGAYVAMRTVYDSTYTYPYVDDITLELIPTCPRPDTLTASNATTNSVDLGWHERGGATTWIIEYGPIGFQLGTGTQVVATSNPYTLSGLPAAYQGEFYVKSICGAGDTGEYSRSPYGFNTAQIAAPIPYNYGFEDSTEWALWQTSSNSANVNWFRGTAVADSGSYSLYVSADAGATYKPYSHNSVVNAAAYRDIDFGTIDSSYTLSFRARAGGTISNYYDGLMVFLVDPSLSTRPSTSSITTPWGNVNDLYRIATVRLDTTWHTYEASFDTIYGVHRVAFFWFNQNTQASYPNLGEPAAVDNIHIDYSSCPRPLNLDTLATTGSTATLTWTGEASANYEVVYRQIGGTNHTAYTNTNSITLTGLASAAEHVAWVRKLCGAGDTSLWSDNTTFYTKLCDAAVEMTNAPSTGTAYYTPLNNYYNYTLTETIIDSAELVGLSNITTIAYEYAYTTASSVKTDVTIWLQPTNKTTFSSSSDVVALDTTIAVQVYSGALNCEQGWNFFAFSNPFVWDGHSNLLVIVDDNSGDYDGSAYVFNTTSTGSDYKTIHYYSDSYNPDPLSPSSFSGTKSYVQYRATMRLISCGVGCTAPSATVTAVDYQSATIMAAGTGSSYELNYGTDPAVLGTTVINTTGVFNLTGLNPNTQYFFEVRQLCDSSTWSSVADGTFTTNELPCFTPDSVEVVATSFSTATLHWISAGSATQWVIEVNGAGVQRFDTVGTNPYTIPNLYADQDYTASVRALCLTGVVESEWSDTIAFHTDACTPVTGVGVNNVTSSSATATWQPTNGALGYRVSYGYYDFYEVDATRVELNANTTSYTFTDLLAETHYEFYVQTKCGEGLYSVVTASDRIDFNTASSSEGIYDVESGTLTLYPNPASTSVTLTVSGIDGEVTVEIVDLNGKRISELRTQNSELQIDLSQFAQGAYFVRVTGEHQTAVRKLIVR